MPARACSHSSEVTPGIQLLFVTALRAKLAGSPLLARALPFAIFVLITAFQGKLFPQSAFWIYLFKTLLGAWMAWVIWPLVGEMRWKISIEGILCGVVVFVLWVGLDPFYPKFVKADDPWNVTREFGAGSALGWFFIGVRLLGSTLVVPHLEEVFYRSFVYRYVVRVDFQAVPLGAFSWKPFLITSALFGLQHREWLAGILCGFAYQGLVCWRKRLGDAMTAHATTNFLLGCWVVWKGQWGFW